MERQSEKQRTKGEEESVQRCYAAAAMLGFFVITEGGSVKMKGVFVSKPTKKESLTVIMPLHLKNGTKLRKLQIRLSGQTMLFNRPDQAKKNGL
ncbi:hypothetical protein MTR_1g102530 [Medicago truncatula]|uniref:Uncharacterized protein n=1 Tax=Medicago truncatula TaxID=3880 RepID=A0A072VPM6_MEDTR|nr:hypothetical protein MTR_1g102530 [Medicago truncatula]